MITSNVTFCTNTPVHFKLSLQRCAGLWCGAVLCEPLTAPCVMQCEQE